MRVLGIETSCDETGTAVYDSEKGLQAHALHSQDVHSQFGGVVPELASRDHVRHIAPLIESVLRKAQISNNEINGIAYTKGPGLAGALMVGAMLAQSLGLAWGVPTVGIHHLEGHLLAPFLGQGPPTFPFLVLLVSGGHTELVTVDGIGRYTLLGDTLDDAVGEAFDKTAKLLGLGYPGGAKLAELAEKGDPDRFYFPRPMLDRRNHDFSFSGLKTYALQTARTAGLLPQTKADIARAFQDAVVETLTLKCQRALRATGLNQLVIAGGVGANQALRAALSEACRQIGAAFYCPEREFCTDNGAMIAYAGCQRLLAGGHDTELSGEVLPRWPLESIGPPGQLRPVKKGGCA